MVGNFLGVVMVGAAVVDRIVVCRDVLVEEGVVDGLVGVAVVLPVVVVSVEYEYNKGEVLK